MVLCYDPIVDAILPSRAKLGKNLGKNQLIANHKSLNYKDLRCGRNSVVECQLPKLDVAGSSPVARSSFFKPSSVLVAVFFFLHCRFKYAS